MLKLDIVTNIVSTLIECTIYTAILNAYWKYESKYRYVVSTLAAALFFVVGFFFSDSPVLQMALGVAVIIGYSMIVMHGGLWQSVTIALVLLINTLLVNLATNLCVEILSVVPRCGTDYQHRCFPDGICGIKPDCIYYYLLYLGHRTPVRKAYD